MQIREERQTAGISEYFYLCGTMRNVVTVYRGSFNGTRYEVSANFSYVNQIAWIGSRFFVPLWLGVSSSRCTGAKEKRNKYITINRNPLNRNKSAEKREHATPTIATLYRNE